MMKKLLVWLCVCMMLLVSFAQAESDLTAVNVVVLEYEGSVDVTSQSGKSVPVFNNMKLHSGYEVETGDGSYAWMSLDDTKVAGLDSDSHMAVKKQGKELVLLLDDGKMFFDVQEKLTEDEVMNVRTSNMVMGITGTFGEVRVPNSQTTEVLCLDGSIEIRIFNPVSGQSEGIQLEPGEIASFNVDSSATGNSDSSNNINIDVRNYETEEIDGFVLRYLNSNTETLDRIQTSGGGDLTEAAVNWEARLQQDEAEKQ